MKKVISLIACFAIAVFAQDEQTSPQGVNMEQRAKIQRLINNGLAENKEEIQKEALYLSYIDKAALYDENKMKAAFGWAALDFFPGFGLGSYIQGDITFGVTQSALDIVGWWSFMVGARTFEIDDRLVTVASCIILGSSRVMSWIFPFVYQKKYNKALDAALNGNSFSYSIDPLIVPKDGAPAVGLAFNLRY